jgi:hypothetical protein
MKEEENKEKEEEEEKRKEEEEKEEKRVRISADIVSKQCSCETGIFQKQGNTTIKAH